MNFEWEDFKKIANNELVFECLTAFAEDPTEDNAVCLIREIVQNIPVVEMALCEIDDMILHTGRLYSFKETDGCNECKAYSGVDIE